MNKQAPAKLEFLTVEPKILDEEVLDERTGDKALRVEVKWQHADIINNNARRYKKHLLQREMDRLSESIGAGEVYGASYHPASGTAEVDDVSHVWEKVWMNEQGECIGIAKVLPTQRGKNAQVLIKNGKIGVSSRGYGTTTAKTATESGKPVTFSDVNEDFRLISPGDFVLTPSVPGARVRKILESQFSEAVDSDNPISEEETIVEKFKTVDELQTAYPELVKSIEDTAKKSVEGEVTKQVETALEGKKKEWKTDMETEVTKQIDAVKAESESVLDGIRDALTALSKIKGVIPEDTDTPVADVEPESKSKSAAAADEAEELTKLKAKNKELQDKIDAEAAATKATADTKKLQTELREKLDIELATDKFKPLKVMLETELVSEDGTIKIESVDKVAETVQTAFTKLAFIIAETEKGKIVSSELMEKGILPDPDKAAQASEQKQKKTTAKLWEETVASGYEGTYEEFEKSVLPKLQG